MRYQIWYPGDHIRFSYRQKGLAYFAQEIMPSFQPNFQCPVERIAEIKMPLQFDFVTAESFGFSRQAMEENGILFIGCGHVSAFGVLVKHTEMAHICKQSEDGLVQISHLRLDKALKSSLLRKLILTEKTARGMAEHFCIEYRNLAEILPELYQEYCKIAPF